MYSFMRRCIGILFGWIQLPMKWIWNMVGDAKGNTFQVSFWLILFLFLCAAGLIIEILVRRTDRPSKAGFSSRNKAHILPPEPIAEQSQIALEKDASHIPVYQDHVSLPPYARPVIREPIQTPIFDDPSPIISSSENVNRRRRAPHSFPPENPQMAVQGGIQTVHTVEEMLKDEPSRLSRIVRQAKNFINLDNDLEEPVYSRNVKLSDAFNAPVYPNSSRQRKE